MAIESAPQSVYETLTQLTNRFFWYLDEFRYD